MKKFLDILLIVLLTVLVVNFFNTEKEDKPNNSLLFEFADNSYTIPASVKVKVDNNTDKSITFNTCNDVKIKYSGQDLVFNPSFCKDITLTTLSGTVLDYSSQYDKFYSIWKYNLSVNIEWKEFIDQLEIDNKGTIKKIFVWVFYAPIYNLMIFLLDMFWSDFWYAIIAITMIIRIILLYPQHKMMVSQKKLQAIQPKIKEIQKEYKWNQQMLWQKLMELYKKENVNPMWSCGFLLIQMPILLVIYNIILWIRDPSNIYYVYSFLSNFDLNSINFHFLWLDLSSSWGIWWAVLALSVALIQYLQVKLSLAGKEIDKKWVVLEKKKWEDSYSQFMPDPEMMNKFMLYWMPIMVWIFTYTLFAWVGLYWWISTLFMLFQQLIVNKKLQK